ncbi:MAG TPA: carbohydrate binding domain-containing protein [Fimbriimonadaceae bacterium]|nr:carbohydrate binding domain-containing protein [Fimbriimonadaceae bacterium]
MLSLVAAFALTLQPTLKYRWVYVGTNLQVEENVNKVIALMKRAKGDGYNGIVLADTKLQRLATVPDRYFKNAARLLDACKQEYMDLIPAVFPVGYAEGMLSNDPNLVEGQPVKNATFVVHGGEAQLQPSPDETYKNGGIEEANGDRLAGMGFQDGIGTTTFVDTQVKRSGKQSLRMTDPKGNGRIVQEIKVTAHRQYHVSAWIKTQDFDRPGNFAIRVFDPQMKNLTTQEVQIQPTQDWKQVDVTFNSADSSVARIYMGVWDGNKGSLWIDDVKLEEVGLLNVIRRDSCPVRVRSQDGTLYKEGVDYAPISDPRMGTVPWPGAFEVYHPAPPIKILPGSKIKEGQTLLVDFDHALITVDHQVAICMSDPKTYAVEQDEAKRVEALFHPRGFFMSHDEIRAGNWDDACQAHGLDAGPLLAENASKSVQAIEKAHPGAEVYVWSDMFDPFHNAHKDYYNVRGDLAGSWKGLPKSTIIVDWYYDARMKDMPFFADLGHQQILAGYYDHDPTEIRKWLDDAKGIKGVVGVMYTTWQNNYSDLEKFAGAAWGD